MSDNEHVVTIHDREFEPPDERLAAADAQVADLKGQLAEARAQIEHMTRSAGDDSCADYARLLAAERTKREAAERERDEAVKMNQVHKQLFGASVIALQDQIERDPTIADLQSRLARLSDPERLRELAERFAHRSVDADAFDFDAWASTRDRALDLLQSYFTER